MSLLQGSLTDQTHALLLENISEANFADYRTLNCKVSDIQLICFDSIGEHAEMVESFLGVLALF